MTMRGSRSPRAWSASIRAVDLDVDVPRRAPAGHRARCASPVPADRPLDPCREPRVLVGRAPDQCLRPLMASSVSRRLDCSRSDDRRDGCAERIRGRGVRHERRRKDDRLDHRRDVRASARRWPGRVRGPTPRSSACRAASTPTSRPCYFELTDMDSWYAVGEHLTERLATFRGSARVFIHNALYYPGGRHYHGRGRPRHPPATSIIANAVCAARARRPLHPRRRSPRSTPASTCGLVQISSASARVAYPGLAIYGAAKASMEQWVRAVRAEREDRGKGPWVERDPTRLRRHPGGAAGRRAAGGHPPGRRRASPRRSAPGMHARRRRGRREHLELDPRRLHRQAGAALRRSGRRHHLTYFTFTTRPHV